MMKTKRTLLTAAAFVGALSGCDGDPGPFTGLVSTGGGANRPAVRELTVPQAVTPNDILRVEVVAESGSGIASLDIALTEGLRRDTTRIFDPPELDLEVVTEFNVPGTVLPGTTIDVAVTVRDRFGFVSAPATAQVLIVENDGF